MLSIEEIKLLIEKLEKVKSKPVLQELVNSQLAILKTIAETVDATNNEVINRLDKTPEWYLEDLNQKKEKPVVDGLLYNLIQTKIRQFSKSSIYNSLEIGPGTGNLTSYILKKKPKKTFVIEKDNELAIILKNKFQNQITIINDDILKIDETSLFKDKVI